MKILNYFEKKREIIESNREDNKQAILYKLKKLASNIDKDEDIIYDSLNEFIFVISDQFLLCRFIDTIDNITFSNHKVEYSDNGYIESFTYDVKYNNVKSNAVLEDIIKPLLKAYIEDPYFCINYDGQEYLPSTIYKDLINL